MPTEPHQPLRAYVGAIRGSVLRADAFGQQLVKLIYREGRTGAPGLFRRVRGLVDAVTAAGGTLADARSWTFQAIRWWRTGQAVEQKFARFEVDPVTSRAMAELLRLLESLPDDLLQLQAVGTPLSPRRPFGGIFGGSNKPGSTPAAPPRPPSPFGGSAPVNPPPAQPGKPFGGSAPANAPPGRPNNPFGGSAPANPPPNAPRPSFGQPAPANQPPGRPTNPFGGPAPANQPPGRPFGGSASANPSPGNASAQPGPFGHRFGARPPAETIPFHIAACFDALATKPGTPSEPTSSLFDDDDENEDSLPDWLRSLPGVSDSPPASEAVEPLPADFRGLLERLHRDASTDTDIAPILRELGKFDDMRAIEHIYKLPPESIDLSRLIEMFTTLGGNVGSAGLISLLPIEQQKREDWLSALYTVVHSAAAGGRPLNETSLEAVCNIVASECDPALDLCPAAFYLLAETGRPEAIQRLWEHTREDDTDRRRTAYFALASRDPGDRLETLLTGLTRLSDSLIPATTASSPFSPHMTPVEPLSVGIPFERLQAVVSGSKFRLRAYALYLLSYIDDPRTIPFLTSQLSRRIPRLREIALTQLRRLKGQTAADAVARLMDKDPVLRQRAAATLHEWGDRRCVPVLLDVMVNAANSTSVEPHQVIERLGQYAHSDLDAWLLKTIQDLNGQPNDAEDRLVKIIMTILHPGNRALHHLRPVAETLRDSASIKVRLIIISALSKTDEPWAQDMLKTFVFDPLPVIAYRAVVVCKNRTLAHDLLASPQELKRVQGVHILWTTRDRERLLGCLSDRSAAVRNLAIWALGDLQVAGAIEALRRLVSHQDRIDPWNQNPAVIAWAGLAKMSALGGPNRTS